MNDDPASPRPKGARRSGAAPHAQAHQDTDIVVLTDCADWETAVPQGAALARRAAGAALAASGSPPPGCAAELVILLADDATLRRLNRDYRGQDRPTNVLAFPAEDAAGGRCGPLLLGDVAISLETLQREAAAQGKTPAHHLSHLTVHGVLHLLGYDHAAAADAARMEALETRILEGLGVPDPYRAPDGEAAAEAVAP